MRRLGMILLIATLALMTGGAAAEHGGTGSAADEVRAASKPGKCQLYGRIQVVNAQPDVRIQVVDAHPDIRVQWVRSHPTAPGRWQRVEAHPDYRVQFVDAHADYRVRFVDAHPGCR